MSGARLRLVIPAVAFALFVVALAIGLKLNPSGLTAKALMNTPAPEFNLPPIAGAEKGLSTEDLKGQVSLVNVFGSWCVSCVYEHPTLLSIAQSGGPPIYGIAWNDPPEATAQWLERRGDPYASVGADTEGRTALALGVTAAPETYVIDSNGIIRYKVAGVVTPEIWRNELIPIIAQLEAE